MFHATRVKDKGGGEGRDNCIFPSFLSFTSPLSNSSSLPLVPTRASLGGSRDKLSNWSGDWIINRGSQAPKDRKQRWRTVSSSGERAE